MEIELQEIQDFLSHQWLFEKIPPEHLNTLVSEIEIRYLRRGQHFPPTKSDNGDLYIIRSGAIEIRDEANKLVEKLSEGDLYTLECTDDKNITYNSKSCEDTLLYLLPCEVILSLRNRYSEFDRYLLTTANNSMEPTPHTVDNNHSLNMLNTIGTLINSKAVIVDSDISIADTAIRMSDSNSSSALITKNNRLVGLVSDSDLRNRCLANNIDKSNPVGDIMTLEPITINENTTLSEAMLLMTQHQIHHLPVLRNIQIIGDLSATELIHHLGTNAAFISTDIEKATSLEQLINTARHIPELQRQLSSTNTSAHHIGALISSITDAITRRLLSFAESRLGPAPVSYAWVAGGSQGRNEQLTHSDQDNALIINDSMQPEHDEYFEKLSRFVCDGLNDCGYIYCPGNAMASNPQWRQPAAVWQHYFTEWIEQPDKQALMLSSIFFDLRVIAGDADLYNDLQKAILKKAKNNQIFLAYQVSNALTHTPPLGFFRQFVLLHDEQHEHTLDIKHRGLIPLVDIARVYALSNNISAVNTRERLTIATEQGAISRSMGKDLIETYDYIATCRSLHQMRQLQQGIPVDNFINPEHLSGLERSHLKNAFTIIKDIQAVLENRYQSARIS